MSSDGRRHPVFAVIFAVMLACVGLALGAATHWYVVDLSDGELLDVARTVHLTGFSDDRGPALDAGWAPSFARGDAHWDVTSDKPLDAVMAAADLSAAGWTVSSTARHNGTATVVADHGRAAASVFLVPDLDGGTRASIGVSRQSQPPTLATCLLIGAFVGAIGGAWWGWRLPSMRTRIARRSSRAR